ncbi:Zn-ribbon domain-containing OB-fold protein [Neobacillus niacini]|uniref:Zn-ribbon domain-containing OB-fold protein n=1 Tax=Neobacillus niacini TaxID=86668 RepID=UPI0007ABA9F4|nr:Zn-ribbon domain-containing OB-fold protein [Neobacillus niacini]MEC1524980.1 Zn-ribbon domain-containing OB-fold protein [Neobacillus niacini]
MTEYKKPIPTPDGDSKTFWDGCSEGKLLIQKCNDCKNHIFYPREVCPHCMSDQLNWVEASGKGKVYSYTIARRAAHPSLIEDVPYIVALIELDEGVRLMSNIINCDVEEVRCDMDVKVIFQKQEGMVLPKFELV